MDYNKLTVAKLKEELTKRGLETDGKKADLVSRLEEDDNTNGEGDKKEEESEEEKKPKKGAKRKAEEPADDEPAAKKQKTGKPKVDECCSMGGVSVVDDYAAMLNQTNVGQNNNKFYVIQVLTNGSSYWSFNRWGRVGENGQQKTSAFGGNKNGAIADFEKKFKDKTGNLWANRDNFVKKGGKYDLLDMEYEDDAVEVKTTSGADSKPKKVRDSTLPPQTRNLIKLIFDHDMFKSALQKMEIDTKKMPLGKISKVQIKKGREILAKLDEEIKSGKPNRANLIQFSSDFFTAIPHSFGRNQPPVLSQAEEVQRKFDLLNTLSDIELANSLMENEKADGDVVDDPLDAKYKTLNCGLEYVDPSSDEWKTIKKYVDNTRSGNQVELAEVFRVDRKPEGKRFAEHEELDNRKLLWHGTKVAVVAAILNTGLRIMPHSGGRVGRGIYFASENAKSAGYVGTCQEPGQKEQTGIMFLNEVALGKEHHIVRDDSSLVAAPKGYDCVIAKGHTEPDPKDDVTLDIEGKKVVVPVGKPINMPQYKNSTFMHSEYLVYKESQVRIRYLLKLKFKNSWW
jgi:poly [ADP-ribose] polymerase